MFSTFQHNEFAKFNIKDSTEIKKIIFPEVLGILQTDSIIINDNIMLYKNDFLIKKDISFEYDFIFNGITINISLEADFKYKSELSDFEMNVQKNHTLLTFVQEEQGHIIHKKDSMAKTIIIFIKLDFFKNMMKENKSTQDIIKYIEDTKYSKILKSNITNIKTKLCAYDIYSSKDETSLDLMFIESKVMEIIVYEFKDLLTHNDKILQNEIKFSKQDIESLHLAKELLINRFINPPSIKELSKLVKLNEFKLKYGFKKLFKISPYKLTLKYKLYEAKRLLDTGDYNVNEVALELGYKQTHGFSNTFFKQFNIRPKEFMKDKNFYFND